MSVLTAGSKRLLAFTAKQDVSRVERAALGQPNQ
jgi:hypothetical protein